MRRTEIPDFFVYGEPARPLDVGFVHVETVLARQPVHWGKVAAHKHSRLAQITLWTSGSGTYRIEDRSWSFSIPTVSFVPSNVVHGFTIEPGSDAIVVSIADVALAALADHSLLSLETPVLVTATEETLPWRKLRATIEAIQSEYADALPGSDKILPPLIAVALSGIARLTVGMTRLALPAGTALAGRLRGQIDRHFRDDWPVDRYVAELGTTRHLLDKAARDVFGMGVRQAVNERRLVEAKRLLLFTIRTVEDIAYETGFNDPAYFSRFFSHVVGMPPSDWRQQRSA
ncbi:helix-turn-helix domain-containing protein [Mesorhizobium sp. LHD-90]|uniref:helix-turn-helix domain-containing protein n=1 Tax=Mesorhizobium sp. LHD-90 TaxID=3071414 RepID=UPI0027E20F2D|nr:helix-turn-helix domain-containing protein [Mesorhizobium sp. LHD-90]MDQ6437487.1 helix-turn-helix domain-containing protein [Mesorhizobium sp. LHD-90]